MSTEAPKSTHPAEPPESASVEALKLELAKLRAESERALAEEVKKRSELQAWLEQSETDADALRDRLKDAEKKLAEVSSAPAPSAAKEDVEQLKAEVKKRSELQAWLEQSEAEADALRARLNEAEKKLAEVSSAPPPGPSKEQAEQLQAEIKKRSELQAWLDQSEAEANILRNRFKEAEEKLALALASGPPPAASGATSSSPPPLSQKLEELDETNPASLTKLVELKAWLQQAERETGELTFQLDESKQKERALAEKVTQLEAAVAQASTVAAQARKNSSGASDAKTLEYEKKIAELKAWLANAEAENKELTEQLKKAAASPPPEKAQAPNTTPSAPPEATLRAAVAAPMASLHAELQAQTQLATEYLQNLKEDQRDRAALLEELATLQDELGKLSNVKQELRVQLQTLVDRERRRQNQSRTLLAKLREVEVVSAERVASLRRFQSALEQAQIEALNVQRIYFQKQIGSLQRSLEIAQGTRKAPKQ